MRAIWKVVAFVGSPLLALLAFMANQSSTEAQANITSYASNPLVRSLPTWLYSIAASPLFLAASFFILGCVATVLTGRLRSKRERLSPTEKLASDCSLAGYSLDNMSSFVANPAVLANLNVLMTTLSRRGYDTPPAKPGGFSKEKMSYFLHHIAAYLDRNDEQSAKMAATKLVQQWDSR